MLLFMRDIDPCFSMSISHGRRVPVLTRIKAAYAIQLALLFWYVWPISDILSTMNMKRLMFWKRRKNIQAEKDPGTHGQSIQIQAMAPIDPKILVPRRTRPSTFGIESLQRIFTPSFLDEHLR